MKTITAGFFLSKLSGNSFVPLLAAVGLLLLAASASAQSPTGGTNYGPTYTPLGTWSFSDSYGWTSDKGYAPVSFTNLDYSYLGDGASLVVDTNIPAWVQYNIYETNGLTNLTVDTGTVSFWFAPNWNSTNAGGLGPQVPSRLLEVGSYTPDSSFGWWSVNLDAGGNNLYFMAQTNDLSSNVTTYLSAPINWTTNYFHNIVLTYTSTNTALYLDGGLAASGAGMMVFPGTDVLSNGFFIGSDSNGCNQAHGLFNTLITYGTPLDAGTIQNNFSSRFQFYLINPFNYPKYSIVPYSTDPANDLPYPSSSPSWFDVISGAGYLQYLGASGTCVTSSNVWMTNVSTTVTGSTLTFNFSIAGGTYGLMYDVFATPALTSPLTNGIWTWLGQGTTCSSYSIPGLPRSGAVFFILGTPLDTDGDGLTDAYELLVSHSNPNVVDTDGTGMPDGWQVLHFGKIGNNPTSDPDQDGLTNLKEYLYGTDPQVSEGFSIWTSAAN
ncbi:MAG TPA: LamG-like jellyroll fold domain-containing protein [Candidatus Sulfotelmatobacter sp.]|jgi:hypothetical protein|nr:LamG-like jellyroll fold domain-containing protein [Candidatus Sulfotelmatobacter sp.]